MADNNTSNLENAPSFEFTDNSSGNKSNGSYQQKHRVKVKKRIRVKQKNSSKHNLKKTTEKLIWIAFIIGFIATLVILYKQLGINDSRYKSNKRTQINHAPIKYNHHNKSRINLHPSSII
ncbi:MAG: hypothetical protein JNK61_11460 [Bacteroidia bacterium]|nr:hypothetical protein [Bacteroidia bacterium]